MRLADLFSRTFGTADFRQWGEYARYDEQRLRVFRNENRAAIDFYCFLQYHLHSQLSDAVEISPRRLQTASRIYQPNSPAYYVEYMELCPAISSAITVFDRIVFHAVSFIWKDLAWLVTAPSGTGKSTHYCLWKLLCPDEIQIINGDKPIVYIENDEVFVTSSPWTGKENMSQRLTAKLGGIIVLEQSDSNEITRLTVHESAGKVFSQFLFDCNTEQEAKTACRIAEKMLKTPVWLLKNRGDIESAKLCRKTLQIYLDSPDFH